MTKRSGIHLEYIKIQRKFNFVENKKG